MTNRLRVGVDLDGVLFNFQNSFRRYVHQVSGGHGIGHCLYGCSYEGDWYFYRKWGIDDARFVQLCNSGADEGHIFSGGIKRGAKEAMSRIKATGSEIHIVTDRSFGSTPEVSQELTKAWLAKYKIPYDSLTFSPDKTSVPVDMFVEDKLENYDALVGAGVKAYLINRPWNRVPNDGRNRIESIEHFAHHVEREATGVGKGFTIYRGGSVPV